jgi:hypothetical protein
MTLEEARVEFVKLLDSLESMPVNPWPFLCASAYIDYLTKLVNGGETGREKYKQFVSTYLATVNPLYASFTYGSGRQDLPAQLYHILRCGIVHSFSFFPDNNTEVRFGGRQRSVLITHDSNDGYHLSNYRESGEDAALLVLHDFVGDLRQITERIFSDATTDAQLRTNIEQHLRQHRPIVALS